MEDELKRLPKELADRCKELGIESFTVKFSGGNDEGYCQVEADFDGPYREDINTLLGDIQQWAERAECYSGAGDGSDYGDDYMFNLNDGTISHSYWYTEPVERQGGNAKFSIE